MSKKPFFPNRYTFVQNKGLERFTKKSSTKAMNPKLSFHFNKSLRKEKIFSLIFYTRITAV